MTQHPRIPFTPRPRRRVSPRTFLRTTPHSHPPVGPLGTRGRFFSRPPKPAPTQAPAVRTRGYSYDYDRRMFRTSAYIPVGRPPPHSTNAADGRSLPMGEIHLRFLAIRFNLSFAQTVRPSTSFHVAGPAFHFNIPHRHFAYSSTHTYCTSSLPPATASWAAHVPPSANRAAALRKYFFIQTFLYGFTNSCIYLL